MVLKDRRGITGIVDAMIFICVMMLVFSALYANQIPHAEEDNRASAISVHLMSSKIRACDIMDVDDNKMIPLSDAMAATVITGNANAVRMLTEILDSSVGAPDSYSFKMQYGGKTLIIGTEKTNPQSAHRTEMMSSYGEMLVAELNIYPI